MKPTEFSRIEALVEKAELERDCARHSPIVARDDYSVTYSSDISEQWHAEQERVWKVFSPDPSIRRATPADRMRKAVEAYRVQRNRTKQREGRPPLSKEQRLRLAYLGDRVFRVRDIIQSELDGSKHRPLGKVSAYERALEYVSQESGIGFETLDRRACYPEPADPHYAELMDLKARYQAARIAQK